MNHPEIIIVPSLFLLIGFIVWMAITGWQRRHQLRLMSDFNSRLLDRLGSVKDFSEFLQTDAGAQFMNSWAAEPVAGPQQRILRAVHLGLVLMSLGIGSLALADFSTFDDTDAKNVFLAIGVLVLSLGVGFLLSAIASYRLASMLDVLHPPHLRAPQDASR